MSAIQETIKFVDNFLDNHPGFLLAFFFGCAVIFIIVEIKEDIKTWLDNYYHSIVLKKKAAQIYYNLERVNTSQYADSTSILSPCYDFNIEPHNPEHDDDTNEIKSIIPNPLNPETDSIVTYGYFRE